jgi:hypothetical protein
VLILGFLHLWREARVEILGANGQLESEVEFIL